MPATKDAVPRFTTVQKLNFDYAPATLTQYESTRTGMRVVVVDQKGPKVNGYFALATEIHDNSGAPHTLEHLIFMGSKSYQYKGLLDKLSSRNFAYTNAWTAVDHTAYELKTAGWQGFAQILPIYLEHLVVPTLTDAACYTEVHHIDGSGNDAGVVYSEMQGCENTSFEIMERRAREMMYPSASGFRSETGGLMKELRSLTADRIRAFHKEMYQPKNLRLVLTGEVDHDELLQILDEFESTIEHDVPSLDAPFRRPWVESEPTPVLNETKIERVYFPEEDESRGEILVGYLGPNGTDSIATNALETLLTYLCGSSISLLENVLVEREQLCSAVFYYTQTRPDTAIWFSLAAVETEQLQMVYERLISLLKEAAEKPLDMAYLHDCLKRLIRRIKQQAEGADKFFSEPIVEDHLFGHRDGRNLKDLATLDDMYELEKWSEKQWVDFLKKWFSEANHVTVLGVPSKELSDKISSEETARVKAQKERLGEDGLKELAKKLENAQAENNKSEPEGYLEQWPVPNPDTVHFIPTVTARSGSARKMGPLHNEIQDVIDREGDKSPLFIHFEHIPSNFVSIGLSMGISAVPTELLPLLSLYLTNLFTSPVMQDGKRVEFEDLVLDLERDTTSYSVDMASEQVRISVTTEPDTYERIIKKLRTILFDAIHDPVRLHASLTKLLADLPEEKRDGDNMVYAVKNMVQWEQASTQRAMNTLTKTQYLKRLRRLLKTDEQQVIAKLRQLCAALYRPENFRIYVGANVEKLKNPVSAWKQLTDGMDLSKPLEPLIDIKSRLSEQGKTPGSASFIVPMSTIDSSFGLLSAKAPDSFAHPDLPALLLAIAFLSSTEGPLWVAVRGNGLAYGAFFHKSTPTGLLNFVTYKSPDAYKAYVAAKDVIEGYATGKLPLTKSALESAFSEIVFEMSNEQPTMSTAAELSFINQVVHGVSKDYNAHLLTQIGDMAPEKVREAMEKYLVPLFKPQSANLFITCAQIMASGAMEKFTEAGFKPEMKNLEFFQDGYGLEAPGDGQEDDEEEDEDEEEEAEDDDESGSDEGDE